MPPSPSRSVASEHPIELPLKVTLIPLADVCRATALEFVNGAARGWEKRELAAWLAGPYRALTSFAQRHQRESERMIKVLTRVAAARPVLATARATDASQARIADLLVSARREVCARFESLRDEDEGVSFVFDVLGAGHVHRCIDRDGAEGWVPVDLPRLRLADRVASLIAVDYLIRADEYHERLAVCGACERVAFDDEARALGACPAHVPSRITQSGIPGPMAARAPAA